MNIQKLFQKIEELPENQTDKLITPPVEVIAMIVRMGRHTMHWKASTLADFAQVSLSTVERVERGDRVSDESLDRIAQALGYDSGAFTAPRLPIGRDEAARQIVEKFGHLEYVPVSRMKTHKSVREAAKCDAFLLHHPNVPDTHDEDIETLKEWLDLASFILSENEVNTGSSDRGRRELYKKILLHVTDLERHGLTVLSGVMEASPPELPDWKVAIVSVTPRLTDPAASKRRFLMVDRRCVALRPAILTDI